MVATPDEIFVYGTRIDGVGGSFEFFGLPNFVNTGVIDGPPGGIDSDFF